MTDVRGMIILSFQIEGRNGVELWMILIEMERGGGESVNG